MCAVAYVCQLDDLRQRVANQRLGASLAAALGADTEPLDWDEVRAEYDEALAAPPDREDPDEERMDRVLGLRR